MRLVLLAVAVFMLLAVSGAENARAQEKDIELDSIVVEGKIMRPQAAYIIQRANVEFGIEAKKRSFVHKIESSIDEAPFK